MASAKRHAHQRLIVHIGTPKTGSSSLQRALHDVTYSTKGVRVAYPDRLSEVDLAHAMADGRDQLVARRLRGLERWMSTADADVFALSSEHFVQVPSIVFASAMRQHLPAWSDRTQVVCYVRPHGQRVVSAFAQQRKSGSFLGSMDDFIRRYERRRGLRYMDRLAAWREVYGDRFVAREMSSSALVGGDVVADFLHLATSGDRVEVPARRLNPSLSVEALALLSLVHRTLRAHEVPEGIASRLGNRIAGDLQAAGVADRGHRLWLSAAQARSIAGIFAEDAARLDETFFPAGAPFSGSLRKLVAEAPEEAADFHPRNHADADARRSIRRAATTLAAVASEHGQPWVVQLRADKGYRHSREALRPASTASVEAALEPVVARLGDALRAVE